MLTKIIKNKSGDIGSPKPVYSDDDIDSSEED